MNHKAIDYDYSRVLSILNRKREKLDTSKGKNRRIKDNLDIAHEAISEVVKLQPEREVKKRIRPFSISEKEKSLINYSTNPIDIFQLVELINNCVDLELKRKLRATKVLRWLQKNEYLEKTDFGNKSKYKVTVKGESIGIYSTSNKKKKERHNLILYSKDAQKFIVDHIDEIVNKSNDDNSIYTFQIDNNKRIFIPARCSNCVNYSADSCVDGRLCANYKRK